MPWTRFTISLKFTAAGGPSSDLLRRTVEHESAHHQAYVLSINLNIIPSLPPHQGWGIQAPFKLSEGHQAFGVSGQFSTSLIPSLSLMGDIILEECLNASPAMSLAPGSGFWNLSPKSREPGTGSLWILCAQHSCTSVCGPLTHTSPWISLIPGSSVAHAKGQGWRRGPRPGASPPPTTCQA